MRRNQKILAASALTLGAGAAIYAFYKLKNKFPELNVFPEVDIKKYMGVWYEIALIPFKYEKGCFNTKAIYSLNDDNTVKVLNICNKGSVDGSTNTAEGKAFVVDKSTNAKLKVQFAWPFKGDYWILDVGKDYEYALVGTPSRENLWILSRSPKINGNSLKKLKNIATREGFDVNRLIYTVQQEKEKTENVIKEKEAVS